MNCKMLCWTFTLQKITQKQRLVYKRRRNFEVGFPLSKLKECEWLGSNYTARWPKNEYHCLLLKEQAKENHVNVALFLIAQSPLSFSSPPTLKRCATEIALPSLFALSNYPCELSKKKKKEKGRKERKRRKGQNNFCGRAMSHPIRQGRILGEGARGVHPRLPPEMTCGFLIQLVFCKKKNYAGYWCWRDECTPS